MFWGGWVLVGVGLICLGVAFVCVLDFGLFLVGWVVVGLVWVVVYVCFCGFGFACD